MANVAASPCSIPITWKPSGSPSSRNKGSEIAGVPSSDGGTANEASPVQPKPRGAGPGAESVMQASQTVASSP